MNPRIRTILAFAAASLPACTGLRAAEAAALPAPVRAVYQHYLDIQSGLAGDSIASVPAEAAAMAEAIRASGAAFFPKAVAGEADALAKARDLASARAAFKPLSESLIRYLAAHDETGAYVEVYCPMKRASWLQAARTVDNPYLGKEMPSCGIVRN